MVLLPGLGAPAASAAPSASSVWAPQSSFGGPTIDEAPSNPLAIDSQQNILVANQGGPVMIFAPDPTVGGTLLTEFGVPGFSFGPRNIAVDSSDDTVYVDEAFVFGIEFNHSILRLTSDGAPTPTYTLDSGFEVPRAAGFAVDPSTHELLVADPAAEGIHRYSAAGTSLGTIATPGLQPTFIAMLPDGSFYAAASGGPDAVHFAADGTGLGTIAGVGSPQGLTWDAFDNRLIAAVEGNLEVYSTAGQLLSTSAAAANSGLAFDSASDLLYQAGGGVTQVYRPATKPGVEAPQVSALEVTSADVSAEVDPGAGPPAGSVAHFEVSADGGLTWPEELKTPDVSIERTGSEEPDTIEADLTGLKGNTDYLVRLVASNSLITNTSGSTSFHTLLGPPEVETGPASSITDTSAKVRGAIDTLGDQTTYHFEYGLTSSYGSKVPAGAEAVAGNERKPRTFSRGVSGLQPNTTYHYRLVAKNSAGEAAGDDRTFTTAGSGAARVYEQVSPRNKMGGSVNPQQGFQAAEDGSAILYQVGQAPANADSAVVFSRVLSRRSSTGWLDWSPLDPPQKAAPVGVTTTVTHGISSDFTHTVVVSNRALTPVGSNGPYEGGGNIYIQDLETDEYTFVGGAPGGGAYALLSGIQSENWFMAGAPDFSWVILNVPNSMLPGAPQRAVYRWSQDGGLELESLLPDGSIPVGSVTVPGPYERETYRQVSDDGSVLYFSLQSAEGVFRRSGGQTTAISVSQVPGDPDTVQRGRLEGASADGRYAFFKSMARLTSDAPLENPDKASLYRYDAQSDTLEFIDQLIPNFNADSGGFTSGDNVWGIGDNGQTAYYVSSSQETYAWNNGVKTKVTPTDLFWATKDFGLGAPLFSSPNGRFMAYIESDQSVNLYDAESEEEICVSCGVGDNKGELAQGVRMVSNRPPELVNDEGVLYFSTRNPLLAEDHNGTRDVYQYHDGQLTLISPGNGPYNARFADATPDGSDVFIVTDEPILAGDTDQGVDLYDARIGGGFPESGTTSGECEGEACKAAIGRPPDLESPKGGEAAAARFAIRNLHPLSSTDRKRLAKGDLARLRLSVSRAGTVTVTGGTVNSSPVKVKKAGATGVPFSLSKSALAKLRNRGKLQVKLSVHFGDANPKVVRFALHAVATKQGGRS